MLSVLPVRLAMAEGLYCAALPSTRPNITDGFGCLIVWISDTRCQGYTELQSLVKCLDYRDGFGSPNEANATV